MPRTYLKMPLVPMKLPQVGAFWPPAEHAAS
jgi:hypothetical protein